MKRNKRADTDLREDPADVSIRVTGVQLPEEELSCETLSSKVSHSAAIITIEDSVQKAAIFTSEY